MIEKTNFTQIKNILVVYTNFLKNIVDLKKKFSDYNLISDYDKYGYDLIQILVIKLIINL